MSKKIKKEEIGYLPKFLGIKEKPILLNYKKVTKN